MVVVTAALEQRIARVRERSQLDDEAIRARDAAQMPLADKAARADVVIDNSGDLATLDRQVDDLWDTLTG